MLKKKKKKKKKKKIYRFENYFEFSKAFAIAIFAIFAIGNWHMKKVPIYVLPSKLRQTIFFL